MRKIRVGSRESKLAVIQAELLIACIRQHHPEIQTELITMKTTGDIILDQTLDKIGGKGLFVKELDRALLNNEVDLTVHSLKDMPTETHSDLPLVAFSKREDPRDVMILPDGVSDMDGSKSIGCSSARRRVQLKRILAGCTVESVRGNVITRLSKLDSGQYGALILAAAGINRLGFQDRIGRVFSVEQIIPASCQGILAVQAHKDFDVGFLECFHDQDAQIAAIAEREFVYALDGGCSLPMAAYAQLHGNELKITGLYADEAEEIFRTGSVTGDRSIARRLGHALASELKLG